MRNVLYFIGIIISLLILAFLLLRTPDTDPIEMADKYGLGSVQRVCYGEGNCVRVRDDGNRNGPTLLLLHGSSDSLLTWQPIIKILGDDYRILSIDLPGHGLSGPDINDDYSASASFEAITALANHAEVDKFIIGGNSMGGWLSWRYTLAHPDKIEGLILIDASGAPLPPGAPKANVYLGAKLMRMPLLRPVLERVTPRNFVKKSIEDSVYDPAFATDDIIDRYWELLRYPGNRRATAIRAITDREPEYAERLNEITSPTLILWGRHDQVTPLGIGETFNQRIPNSKLIIVEEAAHLSHLEKPEQVADEIDSFVRELHPLASPIPVFEEQSDL